MEHHILFLDTEESDRALVLERFPDAQFAEANLRDQALVAACKNYDAISCFINTPFPKAVIDQLPDLKLLSTRSVGFDHIDVAACHSKNITVCHVPDYGSHVIAEHVFALLLSALRHITEGDKRVESGTFDYHGLRGMALKGKTLGILGTGNIGRKVAKIAYGYEMQILATDQCRTIDIEQELGIQYVSFMELLRSSDILTLHLPATPQTHHLLNDDAFGLMKPGAVLVNTARGALIDSAALLRALESGKIAHALLDVLEHEQNFEENKALIHHPNVITTPHIAFYADDSMRNMYLDAFQSIEQWIAGKQPEHIIHPFNIVCDLPGVKK